jgi:hypothetical protein
MADLKLLLNVVLLCMTDVRVCFAMSGHGLVRKWLCLVLDLVSPAAFSCGTAGSGSTKRDQGSEKAGRNSCGAEGLPCIRRLLGNGLVLEPYCGLRYPHEAFTWTWGCEV